LSLCTCLTFFWYNHTSARILSLKIHTFYHGIFSNLTLSSNSFTNIYAGWPGSVHDARVLRNFHVYSLAEKGELFPPVSNLVIVIYHVYNLSLIIFSVRLLWVFAGCHQLSNLLSTYLSPYILYLLVRTASSCFISFLILSSKIEKNRAALIIVITFYRSPFTDIIWHFIGGCCSESQIRGRIFSYFWCIQAYASNNAGFDAVYNLKKTHATL